MNITEYIAKQFSKPTGFFGNISTFLMNNMNKVQYDSVINNINCIAQDRILDIGFGNGYLINLLAKKNKSDFYGIEISEDMINVASKRNSRYIENNKMHLLSGSADNMPFKEDFFDKIYTVNTIYFWPDLDKGLQEVKRVLKKDGIFINAIYSKEWLNKLKYTEYGFSKYTPDEFKQAINRNGLEVIKVIETKKDTSYCIISKKN